MFACVSLTCDREFIKTHWKFQGWHENCILSFAVWCREKKQNQKDKRWKSALEDKRSICAGFAVLSFVFLWGLRSWFAVIMRSITGNKSLQIEHFQIPYSHPVGISPFPSLCEIMQWIAAQKKKDHSMEMWAGTNRIGFDSLDSLSSSWLEFYSTSLRASHFKNGVARGAASVYNWASRQQNILLSVESGLFPHIIQTPCYRTLQV